MFRINTKSLSFNSDKDDNKATITSTIGDVAHYATLVNMLFFAVTVALYMKGDGNSNSKFVADSTNTTNSVLVLDATWKEQGFCVAHADEPFYTSHDVCLYVDTIAAALLTVLYFTLRNKPGMSNANPLLSSGIPGVFGHGVGHGFLAYSLRSGTMTTENAGLLGYEVMRNMYAADGLLTTATTQLPLTFFWLTLIKASLPNKSLVTVLAVAVLAQFLQLFVPGQLGFTYVQTVLLLAFSLNQIARPAQEKDFAPCIPCWLDFHHGRD
jgi:hypothetical protein